MSTILKLEAVEGPFFTFLGNDEADIRVRLFGPPDASKGIRLLKDVVRVGRWKVGVNDDGSPMLADFTEATLSAIVENFRAAKSRGVRFNLGKGHGDSSGAIQPDNLIAPIDDLQFDGTTLWCSVYVDAADSVYLSNPARLVSIGLKKNFMDGHGNVYPISLLHIAVTDHPVVTNQKPFVKLGGDVTSPLDWKKFKSLLNTLFKYLSWGPIPETVTEETLVPAFEAVVKSRVQEDDEETPQGETDMADAKMTNEQFDALTVQLSNLAGELKAVNESNKATAEALVVVTARLEASDAQVVTLSNKLAEVTTSNAKDQYTQRVTAMAQLGKVEPPVVNLLLEVGELNGWKLSALDNYEKLPAWSAVPKHSIARTFATAGAPEVAGVEPEVTDEEAAENAKLLA